MEDGKNPYGLAPTATVRDAVEKMESFNAPAVYVADEEDRLLGLFTTGDLRHFLLINGDMFSSITDAMNVDPVCFFSYSEVEKAEKTHPFVAYPIVDEDRKILDFVFGPKAKSMRTSALAGVPLVIMAGGKGTRLYPYTKILPKALVPVGDKTISERIVDNFYRHGCREVFFVLKHKAGMIKSYFDDLNPDYSVQYVQEKNFCGTGGGLALLKGKVHSTFALSNCDILINDDLACAYEVHRREGNAITFVCASASISIPYGVIEIDSDGKICNMKEKPELSCLVNTGVYFVEPWILDDIEENEFVGFPDIALRHMRRGKRIGVFPIAQNSWIDIGEVGKMHLAMRRFEGDGSEDLWQGR